MKRGANQCKVCGRWRSKEEVVQDRCDHCASTLPVYFGGWLGPAASYNQGRTRGFIYGVIFAVCFLIIVVALLITIMGCEPPAPQRETPTAATFFEYPWELVQDTRHHCAQPWDTRLYMPGEIVTLHDRQTRYPFAVESGVASAPILDQAADTMYAFYRLDWRPDCGKWTALRVQGVPGAGILWPQIDGGIDGDQIKLEPLDE